MPNRTLCGVLEEMRTAHETHNYSYLLGLIEEAQSMGNRMESGLYDKGDHESLLKSIKQLEARRDVLRDEVNALLVEKGEEPKKYFEW